MKLKSKVLTLLSVIVIGTATAQEKRFVEVTVSDTVTLKFTKMIYELSVGNKYNYLGMDIPMDENGTVTPDATPTTTVSNITMVLDKEKLPYTLSSEKNYSITSSSNKSEPNVLVAVTSEKELKKIYSMFKSQSGITGKISTTDYEPITKYNEVLYIRLFAKAALEASQLATAAGGTTGQLISVSEKKQSESSSFMDIYSEALKGAAFFGGNAGDQTQRTETVTKTFKFELK